METRILLGTVIRDAKAAELSARIAALPRRPGLAILQVGDDPASAAYIRQKKIFGERIGAQIFHIQFAADAAEADLLAQIAELNGDTQVDGIIVQLPLPPTLIASRIIEAIAPAKDVDGLTGASVKRLYSGDAAGFMPATARAIITLLDSFRIAIEGKRVVVVGRSNLVGKPAALALLARNATVTIAHSGTADLSALTREADILVVATGKKHLIGREHVREGQTVIDVGITAGEEDGKRRLSGDVDLEAVKGIVDAISPVPGGVGPLTVASLFENLLAAYDFNAGAEF